MKMAPDTSDRQRDRRILASAVKFGAVVVAVSLLVLVASLVWISGCKSGTGAESLAGCGAVRRNTLALGAPLVLFAGGLGAFVRTYQAWRANSGWWIWQGAGWFLMVLMLVILMMTVPAAVL